MEKHLESQTPSPYPKWHRKPLRLTEAEISQPTDVVERFFIRYSLPEIRERLKYLLQDSLDNENQDVLEHYNTHAEIEKLVEASWLLTKHKHTKDAPKSPNPVSHDLTKELKPLLEAAHSFFDGFQLPVARKYFITALKACEKERVWNLSAPADLLCFMERLRILVKIVFEVGNNRIYKEVRVKEIPVDVSDTYLYSPISDESEAFEYFPRYLSATEFNYPIMVLRRIVRNESLVDWMEKIQCILEGALSENKVSDVGIELESMRTMEHFCKMLEACHLLNVRTRNYE